MIGTKARNIPNEKSFNVFLVEYPAQRQYCQILSYINLLRCKVKLVMKSYYIYWKIAWLDCLLVIDLEWFLLFNASFVVILFSSPYIPSQPFHLHSRDANQNGRVYIVLVSYTDASEILEYHTPGIGRLDCITTIIDWASLSIRLWLSLVLL